MIICQSLWVWSKKRHHYIRRHNLFGSIRRMKFSAYEVLSVLHLMEALLFSQANLLLLPRTSSDGHQPKVSEGLRPNPPSFTHIQDTFMVLLQHFMMNKGRKLHTTRSWEFMGLDDEGVILPGSIWEKARFGEDTIIGNLEHLCFRISLVQTFFCLMALLESWGSFYVRTICYCIKYVVHGYFCYS